jgi:hypothetical protein
MTASPRHPRYQFVDADRFDAQCYLAAAKHALTANQKALAHTMLRCADYLGIAADPQELLATRLTEDELLVRGTIYQRNKKVAGLLHKSFGEQALRVVDVGGGTGLMAQMLPDAKYFLCEPDINNLLSDDLVGAGHKFDVALSVHVFEHVPSENRYAFFESLLALGERGVILCNGVENGDARERHQLLLEIYGPRQWIVEHLECGMPTLDLFRDLADRYGLDLEIHPNGNRIITMTMVAMKFFAKATKDPEMLKKHDKLLRYINRQCENQDSEQMPRDYAFVFTRKPS